MWFGSARSSGPRRPLVQRLLRYAAPSALVFRPAINPTLTLILPQPVQWLQMGDKLQVRMKEFQ